MHYLATLALVRQDYAQKRQQTGNALSSKDWNQSAQIPWLLLPSPVQSGSPGTALTHICLEFKFHTQARLPPGESGILPVHVRFPIQPVLEAMSFGSAQC